MSFSAYLVGTWEKRFGVNTFLQIINPTLHPLAVIAGFFDSTGNLRICQRFDRLDPNGLWETSSIDLELDRDLQFGAVKIISYKVEQGEEVAFPGIVGFQRQILAIARPPEIAFSEAPLAAIPMDYARDELRRINAACP